MFIFIQGHGVRLDQDLHQHDPIMMSRPDALHKSGSTNRLLVYQVGELGYIDAGSAGRRRCKREALAHSRSSLATAEMNYLGSKHGTLVFILALRVARSLGDAPRCWVPYGSRMCRELKNEL